MDQRVLRTIPSAVQAVLSVKGDNPPSTELSDRLALEHERNIGYRVGDGCVTRNRYRLLTTAFDRNDARATDLVFMARSGGRSRPTLTSSGPPTQTGSDVGGVLLVRIQHRR